ncbi:MAG: aspartate carbamoyltransferase regulatory subunit, partial [Acetivibrio ethanolgignens]
ENIDINLDVLGYIDPNITVIIIENNEIVDKKHLELPEKIVNVAKCKNPRCITSVEQELDHVFKLVDRKNSIYRCMYCDQKASGK